MDKTKILDAAGWGAVVLVLLFGMAVIIFSVNHRINEAETAQDQCEYLSDSYYKCIAQSLTSDGKIRCYEVYSKNFESICGDDPELLIKWLKKVN